MAVHTWAVAVVIATLACTPTRISSNIIHALIAHSDNSSDNSSVDVENQRPGKDERGRQTDDSQMCVSTMVNEAPLAVQRFTVSGPSMTGCRLAG